MNPSAPVTLMSFDDWRAKALAGEAPTDAVVRKVVKIADVKAVADRKLAWIISTENPDRSNDTIAAKGWDWKGWWDAGAPIMWAHNYHMPPYNVPVAQGDSMPTLVEGSKVRSVADFGEPGVYPFADMLFELARPREGRRARIRAASVGFRPKKYIRNEDRGGLDFIEQEGLEWSLVPIPDNPEAIQEAKSLSIDLSPMRDWCERTLDVVAGAGLWIPRSDVEQVFKALGGKSVTVPASIAKVATPEEPMTDVSKEGRVLSAANRDRLAKCQKGIKDAIKHVKGVMRAIEDDEPDEGDQDNTAAAFVAGLRKSIAEHKSALLEAHKCMKDAVGHVGHVLSQSKDDDDGTVEESAIPDAPHTPDGDQPSAQPKEFLVDLAELKAMTEGVMTQKVEAAVKARIDTARGRLD